MGRLVYGNEGPTRIFELARKNELIAIDTGTISVILAALPVIKLHLLQCYN